ncbi:MAG: polysaccharide biosynthesis protein [Lachnospiraceae bacterium]|nr:polysaccharide biosynthesis protein [Lachnospiraceae bacterium]
MKKNLMLQGSILAFAGLISKVIGFLYRIPMANVIGNNGNGLYSVAFGIYNIALTLSSYSMPLAVSKLMSARLARGEYKNAHRLFRDALTLAALSGLIAAMVLYFGADLLAKVYRKEGLERPLRILAPTVFVVALLGTCRGYFQGHRNMVPTAVSQVIEQIVNAIVSITAAVFLVRKAIFKGESEAAYGAMGGTMGTLAGATVALLLFGLIFCLIRGDMKKEKSHDDAEDEEHRLIVKAIALTVFPVILSQSIYQLGYTLDDLVFGNLMSLKGHDDTLVTELQGVFNTQYNQMINLPAAIATAMASATLPSIVASLARGDRAEARKKTDTVLKFNMMIAIPSAVGLAVLAEPVMHVLFPGLGEHMDVAVMLLRTGSSAVIFYAFSTISTSILQAGDHMRIPVIHSGISLAIHVILVAVCVRFTSLGVYALIIGNVSFPLLVCILNGRSMKKLFDYRFRVSESFVKPALASLIMGGAVLAIYLLLKGPTGILCAMVVSIVLGILIYFQMLYYLKLLRREDMAAIPLIGKFFR